MNAATVNADITALLRARNTLLWITSREEQRVERALVVAAGSAGYEVLYWDVATGITGPDGRQLADQRDPGGVLDYVRNTKRRAVYVLRDFHKWLPDPIVLRTLKSVARELQQIPQGEARALVLLTPSADVPPELSSAKVIDYPLPDRAEVGTILDDVLKSVREDMRETARPVNGRREAAIDCAVGLSAEDIQDCYARSLVTTRTIDAALVASEKRRVIAREKVLTCYEPDPRGLDAVGGLGNLKAWLSARRAAFSSKARAFGLPAPKGVMLVGVPGGGKSLICKCISAAWQMPLLRLDLGGLRSKYVGDSEANIRKALATAEAMSPCVLWLDEIEKALAGATGAQGDGGVAADALGTILSWMQDRQGSVFVIATANDVRGLPPELLRKGRFDELFWVDLPTRSERAEIASATLKQFQRDPSKIDLTAVAMATEGFTGAEIAALVPDALFAAFADGERELTTQDLFNAAATVVPLSKTAAEKIDALRAWAKERARPASPPEEATNTGPRRELQL